MNSEISPKPKPKRTYVPAVTPRLRILLWFVFILAALLGANSLYLVTVTCLEFSSGETLQNYFYQYMFLAHLGLGLIFVLPFVIFAGFHMKATRKRKNRRAVWMGYALFTVSSALLVSGLLLTRIGPLEIRSSAARAVFYWMHVVCPLAVVWLYWLHRLAGPPIKWRIGFTYLATAVVACLVMVLFHNSDPRKWNQVGSDEGVQYFEPSLARTATGDFIPAKTLANDQYCLKCHADFHADWSQSAHRFSSFNNPAYLVSVRETREYSKSKDGTVRRSRWCAGCHDPVPFFSGQFDDPKFDDVHHPTAHQGITCSVCHSITNINSVRGNADFTIDEPIHYPFAFSKNPVLFWLNQQLVKAKPSFHKKTFLKRFHKTTEFCSVCHKVHLPKELNDYKFLRGQNHHDSFLLSGVSGHGARSFYYPPKAHKNCNNCHMPLKESDDFAAKSYEGSAASIHDHLFPGANTAVPHWNSFPDAIRRQQALLKDCARVDIFALRKGGTIEGELIAPLRPRVPQLEPGATYLLDIVIRTLTLGHHFTQGTVDSNEIWLDIVIRSGDRIIGRSGAINEKGEVDPWSHFVNVFMLDKLGNRIDRRNAQDIFVPLYNHQIPPGAGQTVHYKFVAPAERTGPITVEARLKYRKFDHRYMQIVGERLNAEDPQIKTELPITTIAVDRIQFHDSDAIEHEKDSLPPEWQRWNDYGIGSLLKGKAELRQATEAFAQVEKFDVYHGPLNLARAMYREGRLDEATEAVRRAAQYPDAPGWTIAWLSGLINREQGYLDRAEKNFYSVLNSKTQEMVDRGFDFSKDYVVINLLGQTLFERARGLRGEANQKARNKLFEDAAEQFQKTLELDPENVTAHYNLGLIYAETKNESLREHHQSLHLKYKPDDNARDRAIAAARKKYPAANHAAEAVVIYDLQRSEDSSD